MADISKILDKAYEQKDFAELAQAPVSALQGVSERTVQRQWEKARMLLFHALK